MDDPQLASPAPVFAAFNGEINQASLKQLMGQLCLVTQNAGPPELHLLFQSGGGGVAEGVALYNFLRAFPAPITVYNGGSVCSAATTAYLGAAKRKVSPHGSFMIHRCQASYQGANSGTLAAHTNSLAIDDQRTDAILKRHINLLPERWALYDHNTLWLSAEEAVACGLATELGDFDPPLGKPVYAFG